MCYDDIIAEACDIIGNFTPLENDCGVLCGGACCKGNDTVGMELFPHEMTDFKVVSGERRICVCDGKCDRDSRPLSCRIFPFIPYIHPDGHISAEIDGRAINICPLAQNPELIKFNKEFLKRVRRAGRHLLRDQECKNTLIRISEESDLYKKLLNYDKKISKRR